MEHRDLGSRLYEWLKEMGGPMSSSQLKPSDLKDICRGPVREAWEYLIRNVRTKEAAAEVRNNVLFHGRDDSSPSKLKEELDSLRRGVKEKEARVETLEREIGSNRKILSEAAVQYELISNSLDELRIKARLLHAYSKHCAVQRSAYEQYSRKLGSRINRADSRLLSGQRPIDTASLVDEPEDQCYYDMWTVHQRVTALLQRLVEGGADVKLEVRAEKESVWAVVERAIESHQAGDILRSLTELAEQAASEVKQQTAAVDVKKDAESLMFKYEDNCLQDLAQHPSLPHHVHAILEQHHALYIKRFTDTEMLMEEARSLTKQAADLEIKLAGRLSDLLAGDPHKVELCRDLVTRRCDDAGLQALSSRLAELMSHLEADAVRAAEQVAELERKLQHIRSFQTTVERKQNQICILAKQNASGEARLAAQADNAKACIAALSRGGGGSVSEGAGVASAAHSLPAAALKELQAFSSARLRALLPLSTCCINDAVFAHGDAASAVNDIVLMLSGNLLKGSETVLHRVWSTQSALREAAVCDKELATAAATAAKEESVQRLERLCAQAARRARQCCDDFLPKLGECADKCACAAGSCCGRVQLAVKSWAEEPAHDVTPWITAFGRSYRQWQKAVAAGIQSKSTG